MEKILFYVVLLVIVVFPFQVFAQPTPEGACCYAPDDNHCASPLTESECITINTPYAVWYENATCAENPCSRQQSIPTITEWGMIIFVVLAGIGAVYYLRRRRRAAR